MLLHKKEGRKKTLFNDALNTFYYGYTGVMHTIKNYINSKIGNLLLPLSGLLFLFDSKGSFIMTIS